jgi:glycosyltransferase involved in cell wall biosynthesis
MILSLPLSILFNRKTIINLVGFGRIYTDYGFIGRWFFNTVVKIYGFNSAQAFIVEHSTDKKIIQNLTKKNVFTTHGSGLDASNFKRLKTTKNKKKYRFGYISRFHKSKGTEEILEIAQGLTPEKELLIAGKDVKGKKYFQKFSKLDSEKDNIKFLGELKNRETVSEFFNSIDCFLCPSIREGGCIALQEAIWHQIPFITTTVPGCDILADICNCPAIDLNIFSSEVLKDTFDFNHLEIENWDTLLKPFMTDSVEIELTEILGKIVDNFIGITSSNKI